MVPKIKGGFTEMKKTGKTLLLVVMSLMLILVAACSSNTTNAPAASTSGGNTNTAAKDEPAAEPAGDDKIVFGFAQVGAESEWRTANTNSIKSSAEEAGIELKFSDAQQKQENQIKAIRSFIAQKVDVIGFSPVVESGWETVLKEAKDAGIPVILVDRAVDTEDETLFASFIGSDFVEEGRKAARLIIEEFKDQEGPINIVELQGTVGSAPAIDRKAGFEELILAEGNKFKIIKSQTGDFTRAKGKEVMEAFLKSDGDNIDVLYAHNDDMGIGAIQAIEEYGLKPAEDIYIVSVDAVKGAFEAMVAGKLNATVECNPQMGPQVMEMVKDLVAGKELPRRVVTKESVYTMDQAAELLPTRQY
jgi:ABC-type sugar transport system substrate-binding protein